MNEVCRHATCPYEDGQRFWSKDVSDEERKRFGFDAEWMLIVDEEVGGVVAAVIGENVNTVIGALRKSAGHF